MPVLFHDDACCFVVVNLRNVAACRADVDRQRTARQVVRRALSFRDRARSSSFRDFRHRLSAAYRAGDITELTGSSSLSRAARGVVACLKVPPAVTAYHDEPADLFIYSLPGLSTASKRRHGYRPGAAMPSVVFVVGGHALRRENCRKMLIFSRKIMASSEAMRGGIRADKVATSVTIESHCPMPDDGCQ